MTLGPSWRLIILVAAMTVVVALPCAAQTTFSNSASITIADSASPPTEAAPYPSTITVSAFPGSSGRSR